MDDRLRSLLFPAMTMAALSCGTGTGVVNTDWFDRNPAHSDPVLWTTSGWDIDALSTARDEDYLSDLEKEVILHLNMARSDPARYAEEFIEPRLRYFDGNLYREPGIAALITIEGPSALEDCIEDMKGTGPMDPLEPSRGLTMAALDHALDLSGTGQTGHVGSDGSFFSQRIERHGEWISTIGEVISYGPETGREIVLGLLIDDGVTDDSHRRNVLNPNFSLAGLAIRDHSAFGNVCVIDLAGGFREAGSQ